MAAAGASTLLPSPEAGFAQDPANTIAQDGVPSWKRLAAVGAVLVVALAGCEDRTSSGGGGGNAGSGDGKYNCSEKDLSDPNIAPKCKNGTGGEALPPAEEKPPHNTAYGAELQRMLAQGDYSNWDAFDWDARGNIVTSGGDMVDLRDELDKAAVTEGEKPNYRDRAAVSCILGGALMSARQPGLPVAPAPLDNIPGNVAQRIRAGAWTVADLLNAGVEKFREADRGGEDPNSGHYEQALDFCNTAGEWVAQPYVMGTDNPVAQACGQECLDDRDRLPVPVGIRNADPATNVALGDVLYKDQVALAA